MKAKNWTGNSRSAHATLGARNYAKEERQEVDYYATDPRCAEDILRVYPKIEDIWECACGEGHMAKVFDNAGKLRIATDLIYRGYGQAGWDFLSDGVFNHPGWIVTNPPYRYAQEFIEKAYKVAELGVAMFLKVQFLEGKRRRKMFDEIPPSFIYVYSRRL